MPDKIQDTMLLAGEALLFIRGAVCRAIREGAPKAEVDALLRAEELCARDFDREVHAKAVAEGLR